MYDTYEEAHCRAVLKARRLNIDVGIEKVKPFGRTAYAVRLLPRPENRCGWELRCEVVTPSSPI